MAYDLASLCKMVQEALARGRRTGLAKLAEQVNVDRHTLEKAVRITTGKSFRQLQQQALFEKSMKLLHNEPALSIKDIAFRIGFGSPQAFHRFIRRTSGKTPVQIRRATSPKLPQ